MAAKPIAVYINHDNYSSTVGKLVQLIVNSPLNGSDIDRAATIARTYELSNQLQLANTDLPTLLNLLTIYTHLITQFINSVGATGNQRVTVPGLWTKRWCDLIAVVEKIIDRNIHWSELLGTYSVVLESVDGKSAMKVERMKSFLCLPSDARNQFISAITWLEATATMPDPAIRRSKVQEFLARPEIDSALSRENRELYYIAPIAAFRQINSQQVEDTLPRIAISFLCPELDELFGIVDGQSSCAL